MKGVTKRLKYFIFNYVVIIILAVNLVSCGQNRNHRLSEREKVYKHYQNAPLKLRAAHFLLSNMAGLIHVENGNIVEDTATFYSPLIIQNIDDAFNSSYNLIKSNSISFNDFCEYVLPYRINCAHLEPWRQIVWKKFGKKSLNGLNNEKLLVDSINKINRKICPDFKFGFGRELEDTMRLSDILKNKRGTCVTMSNLGAFTFNALGVPVTKDYVICWANVNSGHMWNTLLLSNHFERPFLGTEQYINNYDPLLLYGGKIANLQLSTFRKPGKVYRVTFSINKNSIAFKYKDQGLLPASLSNYRYKDVTSAYCKTSSILLPLNNNNNLPIRLLCNYNSRAWIPVASTDINKEHNNYRFDSLAVGILYQPAIYLHQNIIYNAPPFYLDVNGVPIILKTNHLKIISFKITHTKSVEMDQGQMSGNYDQRVAVIVNDKLRSKPVVGEIYNLFYWENKWIKVGTKQCNKSEGLVFNNVPSNSLYIITNKDPGLNDRPFIIMNHQMKWL